VNVDGDENPEDDGGLCLEVIGDCAGEQQECMAESGLWVGGMCDVCLTPLVLCWSNGL